MNTPIINVETMKHTGNKVLRIDGNSYTFRYIEPGKFNMGPKGSKKEVTIDQGFCLGTTTCTQELWRAVMDDNPSHFTGDDWLPVENVSWDDVQLFLSKLEDMLGDGTKVTLPTEAQWEYACRAGTDTEYSCGDIINPTLANYDHELYKGHTYLVNSFKPNPWGLYQMHGNVWEWCQDEWEGNSGQRVLRGGSWYDFPNWFRSVARYFTPNYRNDDVGFRFIISDTPTKKPDPKPEKDTYNTPEFKFLHGMIPAVVRTKVGCVSCTIVTVADEYGEEGTWEKALFDRLTEGAVIFDLHDTFTPDLQLIASISKDISILPKLMNGVPKCLSFYTLQLS